MKQEDRKEILWFGGNPPESLILELKQRGDLMVNAISEAKLEELAPFSRGVIIEFNDDQDLFLAKVRHACDAVLNHGLIIILVHREEWQLTSLAELLNGSLDLTTDYVIPVYGIENWAVVAEKVARHNPGPGANFSLRIDGIGDLDRQMSLLLSRAFSDFDKIYLERLGGGFSHAQVFTVLPSRTRGKAFPRPMPYLAKIDTLDRIKQEEANYTQYVADYVPFNHRPNLDFSRSAYGKELAVFVEDFIERAIPLRDALPVGNASTLIASLFDSALRGWRLCVELDNVPVVTRFKDLKVLRRSDALEQSARLAKQQYGTSIDVDTLMNLLDSVGLIKCLQCTIHGDLHSANIFIVGGSTQAVLIDFYKTQLGPAVADPACLEVDLAFNVNPSFDQDFLLDVYKYPLTAPDFGVRQSGHDTLWEALRTIRLFGCSGEVGCYAYVIAVVSYLIRFASYEDNESSHRALTYFIAQDLAQKVYNDIAGS